MPITPFLVVGSGLAQAGMAVAAGQAASTEAKYNAKIKEQQAQMIGVQQGLEATQMDRQINRASSTLTARVGKSGVTMSGSPMAALIDMQTQMELDKSIGQFNYEYQKRFTLSEAGAYNRQAKTATVQGAMGAFSSLLSAGASYGMSKIKYPTSSGAQLAGRQ